jgi:hypothetical protein
MKNTTARRTTSRESREVEQFAIDELLHELRQRGAILTYSKNGRVVIWAPNTCIPMRYRQAVAAHNRELKRLLGVSDPRVCSNPELHNYAEIFAVCRWACPICAQLAPSINRRVC